MTSELNSLLFYKHGFSQTTLYLILPKSQTIWSKLSHFHPLSSEKTRFVFLFEQFFWKNFFNQNSPNWSFWQNRTSSIVIYLLCSLYVLKLFSTMEVISQTKQQWTDRLSSMFVMAKIILTQILNFFYWLLNKANLEYNKILNTGK